MLPPGDIVIDPNSLEEQLYRNHAYFIDDIAEVAESGQTRRRTFMNTAHSLKACGLF